MIYVYIFSQKDVLVKETIERKTHLVHKNLPIKGIVRHKNIHLCSPLPKVSEALQSCGKAQMFFSNLLKKTIKKNANLTEMQHICLRKTEFFHTSNH